MSTVITVNVDGVDRNVTQLDVTAQALGFGTSLIQDFTSRHPNLTTNTKYAIKLGTNAQNILVSGTINIIQEDDKFRAVFATGGGWYAGALSTTYATALATAVAVTAGVATLPITGTAVVGIALFGATAGVVGGYYGSETAKDIYDAITAWYNEGSGKTREATVDRNNNGTTISTVDSLTNALPELLFLTQSSNENWDIRATIPSVSNPESYAEQLKYDSDNKKAKITTPDSNMLDEGTTLLLKKDINQITINNHTADVVTPTNLQLRNALTSIDDYQFLLSDILIKPGERLDMGSAGIITVSSGDTLSALAYKYLGGNAVDATRNAVFLNPWLTDDGRIKFSASIDKVLIKDGASLGNSDTEHFYLNQTSADFFYDANGGFDHYYTGDLDIIKDSDGRGEVYFDGRLLSGTKTEVEGSNGYMYEDENYTYSLQNPNGTGTLTITEGTQDKGFSGKYINVEDFSSGDLEIVLSDTSNDKDILINITDPTVTEGDSGIKLMTFTISASRDLTGTESVTLDLNIEDFGTNSSDYGSLSDSSITLNATSKTQTVTLEIIGDTAIEPDEDLWLDATVTNKTDLETVSVIPGLGTILDDDSSSSGDIVIDVSSVSADEGDSGTQSTSVTVSLSEKLDNAILITMSNGEILQIAAGSTSATATVSWDAGVVDTVVDSDAPIAIDVASFIYPAPGSVVVGNGNETVVIGHGGEVVIDDDDNNGVGATPYDDILILTDGDDVMDGLAGNDYIEGKAGNDILSGNLGNDILWGGSGNDMLYGDEGNDILFGDEGNDYLEGGTGDDTLYGGTGDDVLLGGAGSDYLNGGAGFDYYIANSGDVVEDSDGNGAVFFNHADLTGRKNLQQGSSDVYEDGNNTYVESGGGLVVTSKGSGESINIVNWSNKELGIELVDNDDIEVSITQQASTSEGDSGTRSLSFTVSLSRPLENGESVEVSVSNTDQGSYTFQSGEQSKTFTHSWSGDTQDEGVIDHIATLTPTANYLGTNPNVKATVLNSGTATVYDDDDKQRYDPLALDMDKDGFISTSSLEESGTYFDITGDGLRERVGWIQSNDALITYDKNDNGQIDGIDEVFGNQSESGFEELKRLIDSNNDNIIDRKDELFQRLQVWNDYNQDAKVQDGELRSLSEAGVESIDLNYVATNIDVNGNLLTEASKYTDADGNKELAADIQLATDAKDTKVYIEDIPDFSIDPDTNLLPQLQGIGLVYDSFIRYNIDPEFKALAQEMSTNMSRVATEFDTFVEQYSGYTAFVNEMKERYSVDEFEMVEADKKAWIVEHFEATDKYTTDIENYYHSNLNNSKVPTEAFIDNTTMDIKYQSLADELESSFAMQSIFKDITVENATQYFNDNNKTIDEKLYLASVMQMQQDELEFSIDDIVQGIDSNITRELVRYIYMGNDAVLFEDKDSYSSDGVIVTSNEDEVITTSDANNKIVLNGGDDKLIAGKGNNTFYFRVGDGTDTLFDKGGFDRLVFDNNITRDSVEIKLNRNSDLVISLKDSDDSVTIVNWMKSSNRVEVIEFGDGSTLKFQDVFELFEATDGVEVIQLSSGNDIIDTKGGNDVIKALGGNDTLIGGAGDDRLDGGYGNDTYIYNRGDGKDTVIDAGGHDTLQFKDGISYDDLVVEFNGNDLFIGLKEDGKTIEQLSDVVTLKNYKNSNNSIEAIFLDGYQRVDINDFLNKPTEFDDVLELGNDDNTVNLLAGDDQVITGSGTDIISGDSGDDIIQTNDGDDILAGNSGSDILEGGRGNDTYIFNRGDGKDTIYDDYSYGHNKTQKDNAGDDTLQLGEGITSEDIITKYYGPDLMIGIKDGDKLFEELSDVVTIKNYTDVNNTVENILLSDGSKLEISAPRTGTLGSDSINLKDETEDISVEAFSDRDFVHTGSGNDYIDGGSGADDLFGGAGNDVLIGGRENDFLVGGGGDDTYIFNRGDGIDIILDDNRPGYRDRAGGLVVPISTIRAQEDSGVAQVDGGNDTLQFGEGILESDISYLEATSNIARLESDSDDDLTIVIANGGGKIIIRDYFNSNNSIENLILADGTVLELPTFTTRDNTYTFNTGDSQLIIIDQGGNDTLKFGEGITQDDIIGKQIDNDFIIAIKEDGKTFSELSNTIIIKDYNNFANRIENILFVDGTHIDTESLKVATQDDDILSFGNANKVIDLLAGNDIVTTGSGNDTITGGTGDDTLSGGAGNDTYIFNREDGKDSIIDSNGDDTLKFGSSIGADELEARIIGDDLVIGIREDGVAFEELSDKITIKENSVENITLSDGTNITISDILPQPTQEDDTLNYAYTNEATTVDALAGNDIVTTGSGNDTITGGTGDDTLSGGAGNDTYIFNRGDGKDSITDSYGDDTLRFGDGIEADELEARIVGNDLVIAIREDSVAFESLSDKITIKNHNNYSYKIESITLNDDTIVSINNMLAPTPTQGDDTINYAYTKEDITVDALAGNDNVTTGSGNDTITGGTEDDTLSGGAGNDTYIFNRGDSKDTIIDSAGSDTIEFGEGITESDLLFKQEDNNLIIKIEDTNEIVVTDWFKVKNNIEKIKFFDGSTMSATTVASMILSSESDTLFSNHGAEMRGGNGDDTYVYKKDDFTVIINDKFYNKEIAVNAGNDTLKFEDINSDQITIGTKGDDLIIKIEAGHDTYTELKDYVVIRDWQDANRGIESIIFGDGEVLVIDKTMSYPELEFDEEWIASRYYIYGSENNIIEGSDFSEVIESGAGDDIITALDGNDYIEGGLGNDTIDGGKGNDTYVFNIGDGTDTISDSQGVDTVKFGFNITQADITSQRVDDDLVMSLNIDDKVILKDWFNEDTIENRIELMTFDNEGTIAIADFVITPTEDNDNLEYGDENNHIDALAGDDIIYIGGGNDVLIGNSGNDTLYGGEGNDTISGDAGIDELHGGEGDDIYLFGRGDGKDTIIEDNFIDWSNTGNDTLKFKDGVSSDDLILVQSGDDLIVALKEDGKTFEELSDKITLKKWSTYDDENSRDYSRAYYAVESFSFSDGSNWSMSDIISNIGSDDSESIHGFNQNDTLEGKKGDDNLYGHLGNDTYIFNRGDGKDTIYDYGRKGDNYSYYDGGNDTLKFGEGITEDDLIIFRENYDIIVYIKDGNKDISNLSDKITIKDWFISNNRVENITLFDGTKIDYIVHLTDSPTINDDKLVYGYDDDYVDALEGNDTVVALGGNNIIDGNSGDDSLQSGSGDDTLIGGDGNDTLDAGAGTDTLEGGAGDDTYIFNIGDGQDTISDTEGNDSLRFGIGITQDDLVLFQNGNDLIVALKEDGVAPVDLSDKITITNWLDVNNRLENITFIDGTTLDVTAMMSITGIDEDETIHGTELNDIINSKDGDDTLQGNAGNDILEGGLGNDTYVFNIGDGQDTIFDTSGNDILKFGTNITQEDLIIKIEGNNLVVALKEDGVAFADLNDKVIITDWANINNRVELIEFDNGSVMNASSIIEHIPSDGDDVIEIPSELAVNMHLKDGNDSITTGYQNDIVYGDAGNDTIETGAGDDTLAGGTGDDILEGGLGNDTYVFNIGDGQDTIFDTSGNDILKFGDGITIDSLVVQTDGNNLIISLKEEDVEPENLKDRLTIENFFLSENTIETATFANGSSVSRDELLVLQDGQVIFGGEGDDYLVGASGDDTIHGNYGNDTLVGGLGNDTLYGGYDNDTYVFNIGDGQDTIFDEGSSEDYYYGGEDDYQRVASLIPTGDSIRFGDGITIDSLVVEIDGNNLIVTFKNTSSIIENSSPLMVALIVQEDSNLDGDVSISTIDTKDQITIENYMLPQNMIEQFIFTDGSSLDNEEILSLVENDEDISVYGTYRNDILIGGSGNDTLNGSEEYYGGDDTFIGGLGNDTLYGGYQNDTYVFNIGDGQDTIFDQGSTHYYDGEDSATQDTIEFGPSIASIEQIVAELDGSHLIIGIFEDGVDISNLNDKITIKFGRYSEHTIENIKLANGNIYNISDYFGISLIESYMQPIVLDLNSNGITSTSLETSNAYFDYDGDGNREHTAWAEKDDAILVVDLNGDGKINDRTEHFGEHTKLPDGSTATNGYEALAQYDTNGDRVIDSKDEAFGNLLLWQDANQNGKSEEGELINIQLSSVTAIYLDGEAGVTFEQYKENGNIILNETNYTTIDGGGIIRDVGFAYDVTDSITNNDRLSKKYYGNILSGEDGNDTYLYSLSDEKITINDNGDGNDTIAFDSDISKEQLLVKWDKSSGDLLIGIKENIYDDSSLSELSNQIIINNFFEDSGSIENFTFNDGTTLSKSELYDILLDTKEVQGITATTLTKDSKLVGGEFNDLLYGSDGQEELQGAAGNDFLKGLSGDDLLIAGEGDDTLEGGLGDDTLYGDSGDDYYIYNRGDGKDLIVESFGKDRLVLGAGITQDDLIIERDGYDILIGLKESDKNIYELSDLIRIENQFISSFEVETIELFSGELIYLPSSFKPVVDDFIVDTQEDNIVTGHIEVNGNNDELTYEVITQTTNATFTIDVYGNYTYTPNENYNGTENIEISVISTNGESDTAIITFNIEAVNDAPTVETIAIRNLLEDSILVTGQINAKDVDNNSLLSYEATTVAGFTLNSNGSYSFDAGNEVYQHLADGEVEIVTIAVIIRDEHSASVTTDIVFEITGTNDKPIIEDITALNIKEDAAVVIGNIISTDVDDNSTAVYSTTQTVAGFILNSDGSYSFNPADDAYQSLAKDEIQEISIAVTVTDEQNATDTKDLLITVVGTNDAPIVVNTSEAFTLTNIRDLEGRVKASDVDGDILKYSLLTDAEHGVVTIDENGNWHYKADGSFNGNDTATILVDDGNGGSVSTILNFTVEGYIYEGEDLVIDDVSGNDTLVMSDINKDELSFNRNGDDLELAVEDQGVITLKNYFNNVDAGVEVLQTAQGEINLSRDVISDVTSRWRRSSFTAGDEQDYLVSGTKYNDWIKGNSGNDIIFGENRNDTLFGKAGDDLLIGGDGRDRLYGGLGDDNLYGGIGNDLLVGEDGNDFLIGGSGYDRLYGGDGDDWISGGKDRDVLYGGKGDDTYHFNKGDGKDYIYDRDKTNFRWWSQDDGGSDTITFGKDVTKNDVSFIMNRGDLFIQYGDEDTIQINNQSNDKNQIERIELSDGNYLTNDDIDLVIQQINSYGSDNGMYGISNNDIQNNKDLMNIVNSAWNT